MSFESVRAWLRAHAPDLTILETEVSTATVSEAAAALRVVPGQIAKTLALRVGDRPLLLVTRGDARLDNQKTKAAFAARPRMLDALETQTLTGHPIGGVCPFGLATPLPVYCDISLTAFDLVYPAAGSLNSSVCVAPAQLAALVGAEWIDISRLPEPDTAGCLPQTKSVVPNEAAAAALTSIAESTVAPPAEPKKR